MSKRIAIVQGIRSPFAKAGTVFANIQADDLGASVMRHLISDMSVKPSEIDEVIMGNVGQPAHAANIARVMALKAGIPENVPAYTVHRNCASGMESMTTAATKILSGHGKIFITGGTESMSNYPLIYGKKMTALFADLMKARSIGDKLSIMSRFRPDFLKPIISVVKGLTDPVVKLNMGQTAENIAKQFNISREEQDEYAVMSHQRAVDAIESGRMAEEIMPMPMAPSYSKIISDDNGPRKGQSMQALKKLKTIFDRVHGTVTPGNACPLTDGAAAILMMSEDEAKERGLEVLGYIKDFAYAGLDPKVMGLGPVFATAKLFERTGITMDDIDLVEMNEAFAAQILGNLKAFESDEFAQEFLGQDKAVGKIDIEKLNVNGGAIALGHPVGVSGTRIILTLLKELKRRGKNTGLANICIGGGQGGAVLLEVE